MNKFHDLKEMCVGLTASHNLHPPQTVGTNEILLKQVSMVLKIGSRALCLQGVSFPRRHQPLPEFNFNRNLSNIQTGSHAWEEFTTTVFARGQKCEIWVSKLFCDCRVKLRIVCGFLMSVWREYQRTMKLPNSCYAMASMEQMPRWWRLWVRKKVPCHLLSSLKVMSLKMMRKERKNIKSLRNL